MSSQGPRSKLGLVALATAGALTLGTSGAFATTITDPSTLQIGPGTTLDPVQIGNSGEVTVTNTSSGAGNLDVPWLVILGIPNVTSTTATITSVNGSANSISNNGTTATMVAGQEAYSQLGLSGTNNSNSFVNWSGADFTIDGITATSFGLFEFNIPVTLSAKGTDTFQFANLPVGTFVIAYGTTSTHIYDTPFTEAGLTTGTTSPVPEPSSFALLGSALAGLGLFGQRCRKS